MCNTNEIKRGGTDRYIWAYWISSSRAAFPMDPSAQATKLGAELAKSLQEADKINQLEMTGILGAEKLVKRQTHKL